MSSRDSFSTKEILLEIRNDVKRLNDTVSRLEEHQRVTNGRVGKCETAIQSLQEHKWKLVGGLVIISFLAPVLMHFIYR